MNASKIFVKIIVTSIIILALKCQVLNAQTIPLTFKGEASGGTLILGVLTDYGTRSVTIQTLPSESAESVAKRLAEKITINHADPDCPENKRLWLGKGSTSSGPTFKLVSTLNNYYLTGTETGLGIPESPSFLTCSYDEQAELLKLAWENPSDTYDKIFITLIWRERGSSRTIRKTISGNETSFMAYRGQIKTRSSQMDVNNLFIAVVGFCDGIMSGPSIIHMKGQYQDEAFVIPSGDTVLPNWRAWGSKTEKGMKASFKIGKRYDAIGYIPRDGLDAKPLYQVIKADPSGSVGIYRKFLGLTPGHTYRITAALSTLQMNTIKDDWSLDLYAARNGPQGRKLTFEQMAAKAPLPNGKMGRRAGRVATFGKSGKRKRIIGPIFRLMKSRSRRNNGDEEGVDVTLPPGIDSLTVWLRFECSDPAGAIGFMGVGVEDITSSSQSKMGSSGRKPNTRDSHRFFFLTPRLILDT